MAYGYGLPKKMRHTDAFFVHDVLAKRQLFRAWMPKVEPDSPLSGSMRTGKAATPYCLLLN